MNGVDTNVFVYSLDTNEPVKQAKAQDLLRRLQAGPVRTVLLWQVAGEILQQLRRWQDRRQITRAELLHHAQTFLNMFPLEVPAAPVLDRALDLSGRYSLSHWDSMLLGACIEAGVTTLYTEDMGSPTTIDSIQLLNPFI